MFDKKFKILNLVKSVDDNFNVVFTKNDIFVSYDNRNILDGRIISFTKMSEILLKYKKLENILNNKNLIKKNHDSMDIDNNRIRVSFPLL